jgi:hypothetical protein
LKKRFVGGSACAALLVVAVGFTRGLNFVNGEASLAAAAASICRCLLTCQADGVWLCVTSLPPLRSVLTDAAVPLPAEVTAGAGGSLASWVTSPFPRLLSGLIDATASLPTEVTAGAGGSLATGRVRSSAVFELRLDDFILFVPRSGLVMVSLLDLGVLKMRDVCLHEVGRMIKSLLWGILFSSGSRSVRPRTHTPTVALHTSYTHIKEA